MGYLEELKKKQKEELLQEAQNHQALQEDNNYQTVEDRSQMGAIRILQRTTYNFLKTADKDHGGLKYISPKMALAETKNISQLRKESDLTKEQKNVVKAERRLAETKKEVYRDRLQKDGDFSSAVSKEQEKKLLKRTIELIDAQLELDLKNQHNRLEENKMRSGALEKKIAAYQEYAKTLEIGNRVGVVAKIESLQVEKHFVDWAIQIAGMPEGLIKEHEKTQMSHKGMEAKLQRIFSSEDRYCHQDARLEVVIDGERRSLINTGRSFMGGSKPAYYFTDIKTGKRYLYKKAENCCGFKQETGSIVTEKASWLQSKLDPEHRVSAIMIKDGDRITGNLQEILDVQKKDGTSDMNQWQMNREGEHCEGEAQISQKDADQILRSHVVDWLLCNFDTKGENLLKVKDGEEDDTKLVSIDKEGALKHLDDQGAQHMSTEFSPHTDPPIYNTYFKLVKNGKIHCDKKVLDEMLNKVDSISEEEYEIQFAPYFEKRFGKNSRGYKKNMALFKERKKNLRAEYTRFFRDELKMENYTFLHS